MTASKTVLKPSEPYLHVPSRIVKHAFFRTFHHIPSIAYDPNAYRMSSFENVDDFCSTPTALGCLVQDPNVRSYDVNSSFSFVTRHA